MRSVVAIGWLVLAMAGSAAAQPGAAPPSSPPPQPIQAQPAELNEDTAALLSLGGTVGAWGLVALVSANEPPSSLKGGIATMAALGTLFGTSLGHWYAQSVVTRGLGLRVGGAALTFVGLVKSFVECQDHCPDSTVTAGLVLGGAALFLIGTVDDIATAPHDVRRYNRRLHGVAIAPAIGRDSGGVMIAGRF